MPVISVVRQLGRLAGMFRLKIESHFLKYCSRKREWPMLFFGKLFGLAPAAVGGQITPLDGSLRSRDPATSLQLF
jgi:hypothetical protein